MARFAVMAVGGDRPGIVAAVTGVFVEQGCNLEDSSMTILHDHFAMMLVVDAPDGVGVTELEAALAAPAAAFDLVLAVRRLPDGRGPAEEATAPAAERWTVSVYGADRPGIVHGLASLLAGQAVNIVDLATHVIGEADRPVYAMVLEVSLPAEVEASELRRQLEALGEELGVAVHLHRAEADVL